jgi:hypothetical protein
LDITENGFIKNPLFRTLSHLVFSPTASLEAYLKALAARFGEKPGVQTSCVRLRAVSGPA